MAAAAPAGEQPSPEVSEGEYPAAVRRALDEALDERPKRTRQLFHEDLPSARKLRRRVKEARSEGEDEDGGTERETERENGKGERQNFVTYVREHNVHCTKSRLACNKLRDV